MTFVYVHVHCNYDNGFPAARWHEVFLKYFCYTLALSVFSYGFTALYTTLYCNIIIIIITYWLIFILMSTAYGVLHALVVSICKGVVGGLHGLFDVAGSFFQNYHLPIFILIPWMFDPRKGRECFSSF